MSVVGAIEELVVPVLSQHRIELIETQYRREAGGWILRLFVDHEPDGTGETKKITLGDCQRITRWVEEVLDPSDVVHGSYSLEVSSPGINRPLKTAAHFKKFTGQRVKLSLFEPQSPASNQKNFTGVILKAREKTVEIEDVVSGKVEIPISAIAKAHLDLI